MAICCLRYCSRSETGRPQEAIDRGRRDVSLQAVAAGGGELEVGLSPPYQPKVEKKRGFAGDLGAAESGLRRERRGLSSRLGPPSPGAAGAGSGHPAPG